MTLSNLTHLMEQLLAKHGPEDFAEALRDLAARRPPRTPAIVANLETCPCGRPEPHGYQGPRAELLPLPLEVAKPDHHLLACSECMHVLIPTGQREAPYARQERLVTPGDPLHGWVICDVCKYGIDEFNLPVEMPSEPA